MRRYSTVMTGFGILIGTLTLTAAWVGASFPGAEPRRLEPDTEAVVPVVLIELPEQSGEPTGPELRNQPRVTETEPERMAWAETTTEPIQAPSGAGPFWVALRVDDPEPGRLFLADSNGNPLEAIRWDADRDATLGPVAPGQYSVVEGQERLGCFRLRENASLDSAEGQLWTDGELLHLAAYVPGTAELRLTLAEPGYYSLTLRRTQSASAVAAGQHSTAKERSDAPQPEGVILTRELFLSDRALPDRGREYLRTLIFPGLPAGSYTVLWKDRPVTVVTVEAGRTTVTELSLGG